MIDYTTATLKIYWYILDVHGSVVALADESGNRVVNYEYDAWGNLTNSPESVITGNGELLQNANPFRYSSYHFDPESGLYYLKARYYTATLGRFLTRDIKQSINRHIYCENDPINCADQSGNITQADITAYKEKRMSQNTWVTLNELTIIWYKADSKKTRDFVNNIANEIRKSNYKLDVNVELINRFSISGKQSVVMSRGSKAYIDLVSAAITGKITNYYIGIGVAVALGQLPTPNTTILRGKYEVYEITVKKYKFGIPYSWKITHIITGPIGSALNGIQSR